MSRREASPLNLDVPSEVDGASPPKPAGPMEIGLAAVTALAGVALLLGPATITKFLDTTLPGRGTIRSAGTFFPRLKDAYPHTARSLGAILLIALVAAIAWRSPRLRNLVRRYERPGSLVALGALLVGTFLLYTWLSYPPNMFPSNARIHWVDIFNDRLGRYFYVLVKPVHVVFYEIPHILQGLNGAVNVWLMYLIGATLFRSRWIPVLMAGSMLVSGLMLVFANPAEDVHLNVTFLLLVVLLAAKRSPLLGLGLFLVHLGRPPFVVFAVAFVATEFLFSAPEGERPSLKAMVSGALRNRYLVRQTALFAGLLVLWHAGLAIAGVNWIFANGRLIDAPHFDLLAQDIDGFTIYPLSMAYILHMLWIFPLPVLVGNAIALFRVRRMPREDARLFTLIALFCLATLFIAEYLSQLYFNVRFLAYLLPLMMVIAWLPFKARPLPGWRPIGVGLAVLLAASTFTTPTQAFDLRDRLQTDPVAQAYHERSTLREIVGDRLVATELPLTSRNFLIYVLKRDPDTVLEIEQGRPPADTVVFTLTPEAYPGATELWQRGRLVLLDPAA